MRTRAVDIHARHIVSETTTTATTTHNTQQHPLKEKGRSSACPARAEAGGSLDSFVSLFDRCEGHSTRRHRVTSILHDNLGVSTPH